jgi:hypothetical protein
LELKIKHRIKKRSKLKAQEKQKIEKKRKTECGKNNAGLAQHGRAACVSLPS